MKQTLFFLLALAMLSCKPQYKDTYSNEQRVSTFEVVKLFDYDGVSVYRFYDGSRYIYFTNAKGKVEWETSRQNGKARNYYKHQVNCNK